LTGHFFTLTSHFDRPHFHAFQCDFWHLELKHETMMYWNKSLMVCFTVSVSVSMTGQKQILTELKSSWPVILTGDLSPVILNPACIYFSNLSMIFYVARQFLTPILHNHDA
jgi:hypothetical protein